MKNITAQKARELATGSEIVLKIRNDLNILIEENAKKDFFKMDVNVYSDHLTDLVIESLKRDGFKASCKLHKLQSDRDEWPYYVYSISW